MLITPVASAVGAHQCCPEMFASDANLYAGSRDMGESTFHDMTSHTEHAVQPGAESTHVGDCMSADMNCDTSCCATVAVAQLVLFGTGLPAEFTVGQQTFLSLSQAASSITASLVTPPPRFS